MQGGTRIVANRLPLLLARLRQLPACLLSLQSQQGQDGLDLIEIKERPASGHHAHGRLLARAREGC